MEHAIFEASALEMAGLMINLWTFLDLKSHCLRKYHALLS